MSHMSHTSLIEAHSEAQSKLFQCQLKEMEPGISAPLKVAFKGMVNKQQQTVDRLEAKLAAAGKVGN